MAQATWFDPVLAFANAKDVRAALLGYESLRWEAAPVTFADDGRGIWHLHPPDQECWRQIDDAVEEQARLRKMLKTLATRGRPTRTLRKVLSDMAGGELQGDVGFTPRAKAFIFVVGIYPNTIARWYSFALAQLIAQGLGERVGRCELHSCRAFFVAAKSRGPKRRYCSISHGSQARTKKSREGRR